MFRSAYEFFTGKDSREPDIPPEMLNVTKLGSLKRNSSSSDLLRMGGSNLARVKSCPNSVADPYPNPYPDAKPYPDQHRMDLNTNLYPKLDSALAELLSLGSLEPPEVSVTSASTGSLNEKGLNQIDDDVGSIGLKHFNDGMGSNNQIDSQQNNITEDDKVMTFHVSESSESEDEEDHTGLFRVGIQGGDLNDNNDENSMKLIASTQPTLFRTVSLASMTSGNSEHRLEGKPDRLNIQFKKDVARVVELVLALPDNEEKHNILNYVLRNLNNLRTEVTINTHFAILSTLLDDTGDQEKKKHT